MSGIEIKSELKPNEILFMERMANELLPNRQHVPIPTMVEVGALVGIAVNGTCRSCTQASAADLLNKYSQLKPAYDEYLKNKPQEVFTKYEATILDEEKPIFDENGNMENIKPKSKKNQ